jgi:gamma-glutamyltranspeptidase / glutathione hydrolase
VQIVLIDPKTGKQYGGADLRREGAVIGLPRPRHGQRGKDRDDKDADDDEGVGD